MKREAYLATLHLETQVHGKTPVYVDESGFATAGFRRYAYAPKGTSVAATVSSYRYKCTTLIAARLEGALIAPVLFEGSCDAVAFAEKRGFARKAVLRRPF